MSLFNRRVATAEEVEREASRYILHKLGDRLWADEPAYDEHHKRWMVPIRSRSLPADIELGQIILDAHGAVVRAPSRRALGRRIEEIDAILELEGRKPRTRDDSRVRALALATKARRELKLPAKAIDWPKLFAMVAAEYAQGRTEGEIDWERIVADCKLEKKAPRAALKWEYGLAAVIVLGLFVFAWNPNARYRALNKQFEALTEVVDTLKGQNESLQQENKALREQAAEALGKIGDARAVEPLIKALVDESDFLFTCQPRVFSPEREVTTISFSLLKAASVTLKVYNLDGRLQRTLVSGDRLYAGRQAIVWDGRDESGRIVPSALYLVALSIDDQKVETKMVIVQNR